MKPYVMQNYDGRNAALVAARTMTEAARKLNVSAYMMRQMGWHIGDDADFEVAKSDPDAVFYRPIDHRGNYPWRRDRYARDYEGGPASYR